MGNSEVVPDLFRAEIHFGGYLVIALGSLEEEELRMS
jgi:hypothetical protein